MIERKQRPVALFSPSLAGGGAEKVLVNLAHGMVKQHEAVDIVLAQAFGQYTTHIPPQATLVDLGGRRTLTSLWALARYMRERQPRAIICFQDHASIVALWARSLTRIPIPIVATVHSSWSRFLATGTTRSRFIARFARHAYGKVESVVAVSEGTADDLAASLNVPRQKLTVIYNPVVGPELFARSKDDFQHPWFAPGLPPVILGIGRLTQPKDFPTLVLAFAEVRRQMACRLMILGEGEERKALEALASATAFSDDIALPGFVENPYKYLAHSSLFVLSSIWEGLPTALIEALALGVPVVSTDCESGPRETLVQNTAPVACVSRFLQGRVTQQYLALVDEISK
jgi:glycosyltransferase involved in cell wall biosynthesis